MNPIKKANLIFKTKMFIYTLPYHFLVMTGVVIISFLFKKWLEAVCFLVAFFTLRYKFPTTFRAKNIVMCMIITNSMFALSIILCPNINIYIFGGLIMGFIDTFVLWFIQHYYNIKQDKICAEKLLQEIQTPEQELLIKCRECKLSARDTEIAIRYYVNHETPKEIWLWICNQKSYDYIEWDSVYHILWKIGNKLNIKN